MLDARLLEKATHAINAAYDASHALLVDTISKDDAADAQSVGALQLRLAVMESLGATRPGSVERRMR